MHLLDKSNFRFRRTFKERILYALWIIGSSHSVWIRYLVNKWWPVHSDFVDAFHYHFVLEFQKPRSGRFYKTLIAEKKGLIAPPWKR
jgi:hypothetical protein